jgi:uncharacterized membrane protein
MDPEALQAEVDEWVRDGIITESQAEAILERYDAEDSESRSRAVIALSAVGVALVFVGIALFLATNWNDLPTVAQIAVLLCGPGLAYVGGAVAYSRSLPRAGLALSLLGAVLVGPSLFLLADLATAEIAETWLLFGWCAVALSTGHALGSRIGAGIGLALLAALVADLASPADPIVSIALFGVVLFALASLQEEALIGTYRGVGAVLSLAGLLALTTLEGQFDRFDPGLSATLAAVAAASVAGAGGLWIQEDRTEFRWAALAIGAVALGTAAAVGAPDVVPNLVAFVAVHLVVLVAIASTGYYGYRMGSRRFIDLAAVAALLQTLSFVAATVVDSLSGSVALVVAGVILIGAAVALERGRRTLYARLG